MTNVSAVSAASGSRHTGSAQKTTAKREAAYTVKKGDNLTQIAKQFGMTANEFKAWTKLKSDSLSIGQKINLPQSKVPESKGIMALANKYNMDFEAFCRLNNIPKPHKEYVAKKDEVFYVCQNYGKSQGPQRSQETTPSQKTNPQGSQKQGDDKNTIKGADNKMYKKDVVPTCGYRTVTTGSSSVSHPGGSYPPVPVDSNDNVVAEVIKFSPTVPGRLSGKTIMVNAGHGWGTLNGSPQFDIGTDAKDANNKTLEEWNKNRNYADNLIESLRAQGATVIYTTGNAIQVCAAKRKYKADLLISIHCNAAKNSSANGLHVVYPKASKSTTSAHSEKCKDLATKINAKFRANVNQNSSVKNDSEGAHKSIGILQSANTNGNPIPSVLIEMGFMSNDTDIKNIDSRAQRQKAMDQVTEAVVEYLNPPKKKK